MPPQRKPTPRAQPRSLLAAVTKGDVEGVVAFVTHEFPDYLTRIIAMEKACLAPNAIALLDALGLQNRPPKTFTPLFIVDLYMCACQHGADPSTVVHIIRSMRQFLRPPRTCRALWKGLSVAILRKCTVLAYCIVEEVGDLLHADQDKFLTKVIRSADKEFALGVVQSPGVQAFLHEMERTFEPKLVTEPDPRSRGQSNRKRSPRFWVTTAFKNGKMCQVVELIYHLCPLLVGESLFLYGYRSPTTTRRRASWAPAMEQYALFNDKIKDFVQAIQAGDVQAVATQLDEASILVNSRDSNGVPALTLSSTSPNALALLACLRQHLHKHDRDAVNTPAALYWHVSENGGDSATLAFLMDWLGECASRSSGALWDGVKQAWRKQHLPMLTRLLQVGRTTGAMDFTKLTWLVGESENHSFCLALFESEPMQEFMGTLDPLEYDEEVTTWVTYGVNSNLPTLVDCIERWSPQSTRKTMFVLCFERRLSSPTWCKVSRRHELDVRWPRVRDTHLVQRRRLPGLDDLGSHIAKFVEEGFDHVTST